MKGPAQMEEVHEVNARIKTKGRARAVSLRPVYLFPFSIAVLLILLYFPALAFLVKVWWTRPEYSHGFLIPLISLYLMWLKREEWARLSPRPSLFLGGGAVLLAALMLLVGRAGAVALLEAVSLVIMIPGLILLVAGRPHLKIALFPIGYLFFMLPITDEIMAPLQWPLRLATAKMSVVFLQWMNFPVLLDRHYIVLPKITLEVAQVCSGANFLLSILSIGIPLAYLKLSSFRARGVLIVSSLAVGVFANWLRVTLISVGAYYEYPVLHGPFHIFQGLLVGQIGFVYLFAAVWWLSRRPGERSGRKESGGAAQSPRAMPREWSRYETTAVALLSGILFYSFSLDRGPVPLEGGESFPSMIGEWIGKDELPARAPFRADGADREIFRTYLRGSGNQVQLYVGYFDTQRQGKEIVNDRTRGLHANAEKREIVLGSGRIVPVNRTVLSHSGGDRNLLFWYEAEGEVWGNPSESKWEMVKGALLHGRTNGAFVVISGKANPETDEASLKEMEALAQALFSLRGEPAQ